MAVLKYKNGSNWTNYNDLLFPVGSIVMRYTNTSPASLIGGTWTTMTGRFPYFNSANGTDGENTVTLTTAQIPSHNHPAPANTPNHVYVQAVAFAASRPLVGRADINNAGNNSAWSTSSNTVASAAPQGGGEAHNNMPAYQEVWAFRRTA